jgi:hypothetical protein
VVPSGFRTFMTFMELKTSKASRQKLRLNDNARDAWDPNVFFPNVFDDNNSNST